MIVYHIMAHRLPPPLGEVAERKRGRRGPSQSRLTASQLSLRESQGQSLARSLNNHLFFIHNGYNGRIYRGIHTVPGGNRPGGQQNPVPFSGAHLIHRHNDLIHNNL